MYFVIWAQIIGEVVWNWAKICELRHLTLELWQWPVNYTFLQYKNNSRLECKINYKTQYIILLLNIVYVFWTVLLFYSQDIVEGHPGLSFLREAPEFHTRYINTVSVDTSLTYIDWNDKFSLLTNFLAFNIYFLLIDCIS